MEQDTYNSVFCSVGPFFITEETPMTTATIEPKALTVGQFCELYQISRPFFYGLLKEGMAPQTYKVSSRRFISPQAAEKWQKRMEKETK